MWTRSNLGALCAGAGTAYEVPRGAGNPPRIVMLAFSCPLIPGSVVAPDPTSVLFVTLDSCRYDTFVASDAPNLKKVGTLHRAQSPGSFTFSSHSAMFVGFTPGVPDVEEPYTNPAFARIFSLRQDSGARASKSWVQLSGRNIIDGFRRLGYLAIGTGSVGWFDPNLMTSRPLIRPFDKYYYAGDHFSLRKQVDFVMTETDGVEQPLFVFINVGETHQPYWYQGAQWEVDKGPCRSFEEGNDADECRWKQRACLEFVDTELAPLLERFENANALVCADHGDAWGEDDQWGHGFNHPKVFEVPLIYRLNTPPTVTKPDTGPRPQLGDRLFDLTTDAAVDLGRAVLRKVGRKAPPSPVDAMEQGAGVSVLHSSGLGPVRHLGFVPLRHVCGLQGPQPEERRGPPPGPGSGLVRLQLSLGDVRRLHAGGPRRRRALHQSGVRPDIQARLRARAGMSWARLSGRNVIDAFRRLGYLTIGTGAVSWFDPMMMTSRPLIRPFDRFYYPGDRFSVRKQVDFIMNETRDVDQPMFVFMNIGETHQPYWHEGASWKFDKGPCRSFEEGNDLDECRRRQRACLEFVDAELAPVLERFGSSNAVICADHGDALGRGRPVGTRLQPSESLRGAAPLPAEDSARPHEAAHRAPSSSLGRVTRPREGRRGRLRKVATPRGGEGPLAVRSPARPPARHLVSPFVERPQHQLDRIVELHIGAQFQLRRLGRLIWVVQSRERRDSPDRGACVEPLRVPLGADLDRSCHVDFDERQTRNFRALPSPVGAMHCTG